MAKTYSMQFGAGDPRTYTGLSPTFLIFTNISSGATVTPPTITEALTGSGLYRFTWGTTTPIAFLADAATTSPGSQGRYVTGQIDPADRADEYGATIVALGITSVALGTTNMGFGVTSISYLSGIGTTLTTMAGTGITNIALGTTAVALGTTILAGQINMAQTLIAIGSSFVAFGTSLTVTVAGIGSTASSFGTNASDPVDLFGYMKRIQENLEGNSSFTKLTGAWSIYNRGASVLLASKVVANNSSQVIKT